MICQFYIQLKLYYISMHMCSLLYLFCTTPLAARQTFFLFFKQMSIVIIIIIIISNLENWFRGED